MDLLELNYKSITESYLKILKYLKINGNVFPKEIDVFTDDETETKGLISANFAKFLILEVQKYFKTDDLQCAFYKNVFYLSATNNRNDECKIESIVKEVSKSVSFLQMSDKILNVYKLIDFLNE